MFGSVVDENRGYKRFFEIPIPFVMLLGSTKLGFKAKNKGTFAGRFAVKCFQRKKSFIGDYLSRGLHKEQPAAISIAPSDFQRIPWKMPKLLRKR